MLEGAEIQPVQAAWRGFADVSMGCSPGRKGNPSPEGQRFVLNFELSIPPGVSPERRMQGVTMATERHILEK